MIPLSQAEEARRVILLGRACANDWSRARLAAEIGVSLTPLIEWADRRGLPLPGEALPACPGATSLPPLPRRAYIRPDGRIQCAVHGVLPRLGAVPWARRARSIRRAHAKCLEQVTA